jgi:hypothetical protein
MNKELAAFWQVSDKVPVSVIKTVTDKCIRDDCCISARVQMTTCAGVSDHYNKDGILIINDRNRFNAYLCCISCKHGWNVRSNGEIVEELDFSKGSV